MLVVAGTGHGKTQTLQHLLMHDLTRKPAEVPSLVIIDSQGDMLSKLAHLELLHPDHGALSDRLIIIDPTDIEHPPALGLFDVKLHRVQGYDARYREQIMNGVAAAIAILDRGYGKAPQHISGKLSQRYVAELPEVCEDGDDWERRYAPKRH
jgi:hypothetical protein